VRGHQLGEAVGATPPPMQRSSIRASSASERASERRTVSAERIAAPLKSSRTVPRGTPSSGCHQQHCQTRRWSNHRCSPCPVLATAIVVVVGGGGVVFLDRWQRQGAWGRRRRNRCCTSPAQVRTEERFLKPQRRLDDPGDRRPLVPVVRFVVRNFVDVVAVRRNGLTLQQTASTVGACRRTVLHTACRVLRRESSAVNVQVPYAARRQSRHCRRRQLPPGSNRIEATALIRGATNATAQKGGGTK
jgi:hypothetical protein